MNFLKTTIKQSFITLSIIAAAFVSCEAEESEEIAVIEEEIGLTEEEFAENLVLEDANIDETSVTVDDVLVTSAESDLEIRLDNNNTYFYVDNGDMKKWESFRIYYTTYSNSKTSVKFFSINSTTKPKWIGAKVWGAGNNRATVRVVPFSANNDTYYWGKAKTYYLWFNSTGGETLYATIDSSDPNG